MADETNRYGMRRAADAFRDGAIDTAVEQLQAAIELAPNRAEPHRILGLVWAAAEQYDRSVNELKAGRDTVPLIKPVARRRRGFHHFPSRSKIHFIAYSDEGDTYRISSFEYYYFSSD